MKNLYMELKTFDRPAYIIIDKSRNWEGKAMILYRGDKRYKKAVAGGKAIDNALNKEKSKFLTDQWLKWFDEENHKELYNKVILM